MHGPNKFLRDKAYMFLHVRCLIDVYREMERHGNCVIIYVPYCAVLNRSAQEAFE